MRCVVDSAGTIISSAVEPCPGFFIFEPAEAGALLGQITVENLATIGVTPESLGTAFVMGFGGVVGITFIAWACSLALTMIRKA